MAFSSSNNHRAPMSEINVTPLVDVMLVLLIIFMVTAPMMQEGFNLDVPEAPGQALGSEESREQVEIAVTKDGQILINNVATPEAELVPKILQVTKDRPKAEVNLRADKSVSYGTVMRIFGALSNAGVRNVGMVTTRQEEPATKK